MKRVRNTQAFRRMAFRATVAALAGFATAALIGAAAARTFALQVAKDAQVTDQSGASTRENIVTSRGFAVYMLSGDSKSHPKCKKSNGCFTFWPPVTVSSPKKLSKAPGVKGRLGVWHRDGFFQILLGGHPLYRFASDSQKGTATGEGIRGFGGTWHATKAAKSGSGTTTMSAGTTTTTSGTTPMTTGTTTMPTPTTTTTTTTTTGTTTTTTPTTTTTTCAYPPYC